MARKIKSIRQKTSSGYGDDIPLGGDASNIDTEDGQNVQTVLNDIMYRLTWKDIEEEDDDEG